MKIIQKIVDLFSKKKETQKNPPAPKKRINPNDVQCLYGPPSMFNKK